jgi:histone H3/H4
MLIVTSRVKQLVRKINDFNTSAEVPDALTEHVEKIVKTATHYAEQDGRKTVMGRDIKEALTKFQTGELL